MKLYFFLLSTFADLLRLFRHSAAVLSLEAASPSGFMAPTGRSLPVGSSSLPEPFEARMKESIANSLVAVTCAVPGDVLLIVLPTDSGGKDYGADIAKIRGPESSR